MRVVIAGAGAVGRSVAQELIDNGHTVLLIDKSPSSIRADVVPDAQWLLADADAATGGMVRRGSQGGSGAGSGASCRPTSRLI